MTTLDIASPNTAFNGPCVGLDVSDKYTNYCVLNEAGAIVAEGKIRTTQEGSRALVEGRLSIRSYEDTTGTKRKATEIVINDMQMLGEQGDGSKAAASTSVGKSNRTFVKRKGADDSAYAGRFV